MKSLHSLVLAIMLLVVPGLYATEGYWVLIVTPNDKGPANVFQLPLDSVASVAVKASTPLEHIADKMVPATTQWDVASIPRGNRTWDVDVRLLRLSRANAKTEFTVRDFNIRVTVGEVLPRCDWAALRLEFMASR